MLPFRQEMCVKMSFGWSYGFICCISANINVSYLCYHKKKTTAYLHEITCFAIKYDQKMHYMCVESCKLGLKWFIITSISKIMRFLMCVSENMQHDK